MSTSSTKSIILVCHHLVPIHEIDIIKIEESAQGVWNIREIGIGFPFAKLLRNFCGTKRKIFLSLRFSFARKNSKLRNHSQKSFRAKLPYSAFAKLKFCAIPQLQFCAIPQFHENQTVGDGVCFLEFNSGKILFGNVFLLVTFTLLTNDS